MRKKNGILSMIRKLELLKKNPTLIKVIEAKQHYYLLHNVNPKIIKYQKSF